MKVMPFSKAAMQCVLALLFLRLNSKGVRSREDGGNVQRQQAAYRSGDAIDFSKSSLGTPQENEPVEYGVDVSFPIQHRKTSQNFDWLPHKYVSIQHVWTSCLTYGISLT